MSGVCHECGRSNVKLWRKSHGYPNQGDILCSKHLRNCDFPLHESDQRINNNGIGFVPALPITGEEDDNGNIIYWSYGVVPKDAADNWYSLSE